MLLAWASEELRRVCASADGFIRHCPAHVDAARDLLSAVIHAPDLVALNKLQWLQVRPTVRTDGGYATVTIELEEIEMQGSVLSKTGRQIRLDAASEFWEVATAHKSLLVEGLVAQGQSVVRAVG